MRIKLFDAGMDINELRDIAKENIQNIIEYAQKKTHGKKPILFLLTEDHCDSSSLLYEKMILSTCASSKIVSFDNLFLEGTTQYVSNISINHFFPYNIMNGSELIPMAIKNQMNVIALEQEAYDSNDDRESQMINTLPSYHNSGIAVIGNAHLKAIYMDGKLREQYYIIAINVSSINKDSVDSKKLSSGVDKSRESSVDLSVDENYIMQKETLLHN